MRRRTATACLASTLFLAACGTTVPMTRSMTDGQMSSDSGSLGQSPAAAGATGVGATGQGPVAGALGGTGAGSVAGGVNSQGFGPQASGSTAVAPGVTGRGVTPKTLTIGIAIATDTSAVGSSMGISGAGSVSEQDIWNALVQDVNRNGGILGRRLLLYTHAVNLASYVANPSETYAQACSDFRDDHKVFATLISIADPALRDCFAAMGTPFIVYDGNVGSLMPASAYREHGGNYLYAPDAITMERLAQLFVQSLVERKFMSPWDTTAGAPGGAPVKLGLIHADTPDQNSLYADYARELAKYGMHFADTVTYSGDVSTAMAATQSAVLKFASEGVTHVFGASAFFLRDAESQHYRPRYAYLPALGAFGAQNSPAVQLHGAMTVGWAPAVDVNAAQDPGPTPGSKHCLTVLRAAGLTPSNGQDRELMFAVCDAVYSLRAALTTGGSPTVAGLRRGYEALGTSFPTALAFAARLGPGRHNGVDSVRDMAFDATCSCLKYTSRTNRS